MPFGELGRIIQEERLDPEQTRAFIETAFRDGVVQTTGTAITKILPPVSRFTPDSAHDQTKQSVLTRLRDYFDRFAGLS